MYLYFRLLFLRKNDEKVKFGMLVKRAILVLDAKQRAKLPPEIKEIIQKRYEAHQEKKMMYVNSQKYIAVT